MNYDTMSVDRLIDALIGAVAPDYVWTNEYRVKVRDIESALRKAVLREASVTWTRKYSMANASGVSCLVGKFPNGYRLDLENDDIPDGDYDLIPRETP